MSLTNIYDAYSIVRQVNPGYSGALFQLKELGGGTLQDIGFDGNGDVDTAAIASHCGASVGVVEKIYSQYTDNDLTWTISTDSFKPRVYDGSAVVIDAQGNLVMDKTYDNSAGNQLTSALPSALPTGSVSIFVRMSLTDDTDDNRFMSVTDADGEIFYFGYESGSSSTFIDQNQGSGNGYYKGTTEFTGSNKGDMYNFVTFGAFENYSIHVGSIPDNVPSELRFFGGASRDWSPNEFQEILFYSVDRSGDVATINTYLNNYYVAPPQPISGTINDEEGNPVENAIVKIFTESSLEDQTEPTFVETVLTDANGDWAMQAAYDETVGLYKVEVRKFIPKYTGTIDSATASSFTDAGAFTAGEFDDGQAIVRMTGGAADGDERQIDGNADTDTCDIDGTFSTTPSAGDPYEAGYMFSDELKFKPPKSAA